MGAGAARGRAPGPASCRPVAANGSALRRWPRALQSVAPKAPKATAAVPGFSFFLSQGGGPSTVRHPPTPGGAAAAAWAVAAAASGGTAEITPAPACSGKLGAPSRRLRGLEVGKRGIRAREAPPLRSLSPEETPGLLLPLLLPQRPGESGEGSPGTL